MDKWGYNYLIESKTLWEKEKLLIMSNFSFSHNVFKSCLLLMRQNEYLWRKVLTNPKNSNHLRKSSSNAFSTNKYQTLYSTTQHTTTTQDLPFPVRVFTQCIWIPYHNQQSFGSSQSHIESLNEYNIQSI